MKKIFTLIIALMGFAGAANAASIDEIAPLKHSYVLVGDDYTNDGTEKIAKNALFGDDHFFTPTGHDKATNKGSIDLSSVDEVGIVTEEIAGKYGEYGNHLNSLRLKTNQDVFAISVTAKSKIIIFYENNKAKRYPIFAKDAKLENKLSSDADIKADGVIGSKGYGRIEWTATDDGIVYVGAENQIFVSYVIIEANEAPGTPTVKVGPQTYEGGLWFREVTAKANDIVEEGSTEKIPTVLTYTTDGSAPTAASTVYTEPIKCYKDMIVKFQAFMDLGDGKPANDLIADGADNEGNVNFTFNSPSITADGANVTITSEYDGAKNYYKLNGANAIEGSTFTLTESATVEAYSQIVNGEYTTFTTKSTTKDVYVLNPIKEKKTITVTAADVVIDDEATAASTDESTVYKVENGAISADKKDFFVKNLTFGVLKDAKAQYQVPEGQEAYIQMSNTNIVFQVAEGDSVVVKVVCSKNSCKNLDADDAAEDKLDNGCTPDRQCYVNVSGTNYCLTDAEGKHTNDLKLYPNANVFEFGLGAGTWTFQKYSGTGNILISSIEITPAAAAAAETETVLWEGEAIVNGWANQPTFLSDGGAELTAAGAAVGDRLRIYFTAPDDNWQVELTNGHWDGMLDRYATKDLGPEQDGSPRHYTIVDQSLGYFEYTIDQDFLTKATTKQNWGGAFLLNGDGNMTVTKVTLVKGGATGIATVKKTVKSQSNVIYNLAGQRVDANYKGVVIVNGKKMIQK
jgi:hypothetical protein